MEKKEKVTRKKVIKKEENLFNENKDNNRFNYVILFLVGLFIGIIGTVLISSNNSGKTTKVVRTDSRFEPLYEAFDAVKENYYKEVDDDVLINGAVDGLMKSLGDKHSNFFNKEQKKMFESELSGVYYGIGAEIKPASDDEVMINKVFDDSPAEKAGLKTGDIFVSIDGESSKGKTTSEISQYLRSEKKDSSTIVVRRNGKEKEIKVEKDNVTLLSVSSEMLENNIGYIAVSMFADKTYEQFTKALTSLEEKGLKSLIIDLRGNGGGYLYTVTEMISEFVDHNTVIYQIKTKDLIERYGALNDKTKSYKVVILVDEDSASASEIMASAMQEQYHAILVGKTTYGKGTVQVTLDLSNDTLIKYTIQEWLTSIGNSINDVGVKPDVEVELSEDFIKHPSRENDNQLQKAIEILK